MNVKGKGLRALNKPKPKVKKDFKAKKITQTEVIEVPFTCTCCGKEYKNRKGYSFKTSSVLYSANDGYIPICKKCVNGYYDQLVEFFDGDEASAVERLCQLFDIYYNDEVVTHVLKDSRGVGNRFTSYIAQMNLAQNKNKGTDYLQSVADAAGFEEPTETSSKIHSTPFDKFEADNGEDEGGFEGDELYESDIEVTPELKRKWGNAHTGPEYAFLEEEYNGWVSYLGWTEKPQLELIKGLCWAQLDIRKCGVGNTDKRSAALKAYQDLLGTCNLKPSQNMVGDKNVDPLGVMIKKFETEKPIGEPLPEFQDVDNVRKYFNTWMLGGLGKALKIKNPNTKLYDEAVEEMKRYTVSPETTKKNAIVGDVGILDNATKKKEKVKKQ